MVCKEGWKQYDLILIFIFFDPFIEGKMFCHEQSALKLAAHALQAERGDYSAMNKNQAYFKLEDYMPTRVCCISAHYYWLCIEME